MKITKNFLQKIIKEEIDKLMNEHPEAQDDFGIAYLVVRDYLLKSKNGEDAFWLDVKQQNDGNFTAKVYSEKSLSDIITSHAPTKDAAIDAVSKDLWQGTRFCNVAKEEFSKKK